ncbi:MAG: hypothetical protein Q9225_004164, partial [Loekoesia sp. 1 TL-2023]
MADNIIESIEQLELEVLIPQATDFNLEGLTALSSIPLRSSLHFDEQLNVLIILRAPSGSFEWKKHLPNLQMNLEVQAFGSSDRTSDGQESENHSGQPHFRDVVWSGIVDTDQEPVVIDDESNNTLVWTVECFINRPRVRMQHPMVSFKASGILKQPPSSSEESTDPYLPSGVPASINVLEPLSGDPGLGGTIPQLTALRLDRINLKNTLTAKEQVIRSAPQKPLSALPAISARVRYSKSGAYTGRPSVVASLDIETAPFQDDRIELTHVSMELSDGSAEDLCKGHAINLPMTCQPQDNIVFLFRLMPNDAQTHSSRSDSASRALDISINARVLISDTCRPNIQMRWKTVVDFSTALNPKFGSPTQAMQRSKRPSNLSVASDTNKRLPQDDTAPSDGTDDAPSNQRASSHPNFGITLTLTAPKDVYVGQPFTWDVFLVNHSNKARKLAILVIPKRKLSDHKIHISKTSVSSTVTGQAGKIDHADAVMDENRLYAMQKGLGREDVGIVCLSTEIRLG